MTKRWILGPLLSLGLLLASPLTAGALNLTVSAGGIDSATTRTCTTTTCGTAVWSLADGEQFPVGGTITIDTVNDTISFSLSAASVVIDADPDLGQVATYAGASALSFTDGTYIGNAISVTATPDGGGSTTYSIAPGAFADVSFSDVQAVGNGSPGGPLGFSATLVTGSCLISANGTGQCGLTFGAIGTTQFVIPGGTDFGGFDSPVRHAMNIGVVPEPGTVMLLGLGLGALALRRRNA